MAKLNDDNGYYKLRVTKTAAKKIKQLITKPRNQGKKNGIEGVPQEGGGGSSLSVTAPSSEGSSSTTTKETSELTFGSNLFWSGDTIQSKAGGGSGGVNVYVQDGILYIENQ